MQADIYEVKLTFREPILGATPKDPEIYKGYIATKAALTDEQIAEELKTVEKVEEKGWTGFHMIGDQPILLNYCLKGFFKDACGMLRRVPGSQSKGLKAYKKVIDGLVFVKPREIPLVLPEGETMGVLERPLRAQTAQGERVTLARSDTCPVGTTMEFTVEVLGGVSEALLREWFEYGERRGLSQWRNAEFGSFEYVMTHVG